MEEVAWLMLKGTGVGGGEGEMKLKMLLINKVCSIYDIATPIFISICFFSI